MPRNDTVTWTVARAMAALLRQLNRFNAAPVSRGQFSLQPLIW